jgi:hypothetical protein
MALLDPPTGARPQSYRVARDVGKLVERPGALLGAAPLLLAIFLAAGAAASLAWQTAVHALAFDGDFSDGPFQLYNALRRIAGGQIYGRDFQAFTGIGTNWAHLPIYLLAGADFRASEISRFLTSGLCHGAAAVVLARAFGQAFPTRRDARLFGLLFFAAGAAVYWRTFQPGVSLLGVRTFFPLLLAAALAAPRPALWMAVALAASLLSSVDHAVAALVALAGALAVTFMLKATQDRRLPLLLGTAAGIGLFTAVLLAATAGNVSAPLRYALFDIPADQFWYFGAPPVEFLPLNAPALLRHRTFAEFGMVYVLGAAAASYLWVHRPWLAPSVTFLLAYATLGMVSQLSYLSPINLHGSERALFALILAALLTWQAPRLVPVALVAVGLSIAAAAFQRLQLESMPQGRDFLSAEWRRHLAAVDRNAASGPLWSVYAGLPEAQRGIFHADSDDLIHALGPERRARYVTRFLETKPALVRLDPPRWPFAAWFLLQNWPFYREVFRAYEPIYSDDLGSLWRPAGLPRSEAHSVAGSIDDRGCVWLAAAPADAVYSVAVDYEVTNPWRSLPVLGATPRLLLDVTGTSNRGFELVSLPGGSGYGGHFVFPVLARAGQPVAICPQVSSLLPGVALSLSEVTAARERLSEPVVRYIFSVVRGEWRKGARHDPPALQTAEAF